jgi:hypothetical protein
VRRIRLNLNDASKFYPAVGGQSVLLPMQTRTIQGFEFVTPVDDLIAFLPVTNTTPERPSATRTLAISIVDQPLLFRFQQARNRAARRTSANSARDTLTIRHGISRSCARECTSIRPSGMD